MVAYDPSNKLASATLDMATVVYEAVRCAGSCDHTLKWGLRDFHTPLLGSANAGSPSAYGDPVQIFKKAVDVYFLDRPYRRPLANPLDADYDGLRPSFTDAQGRVIPMLPPEESVGDFSANAKTTDNGILDGGEGFVFVRDDLGNLVVDGGGNPIPRLRGDVFDRNSFAADMSALDINNDGCVELPLAYDPSLLGRCDPHADFATGEQATKRQVVRQLITHELGHAVGIGDHSNAYVQNPDAIAAFNLDWTRDGYFSPGSAAKVMIHNRGRQ
jgi:hypothetical protein